MAGVCAALPVLKAQMACVLIQLETTPQKDGRILRQVLGRIAKLFAVLIRVGCFICLCGMNKVGLGQFHSKTIAHGL